MCSDICTEIAKAPGTTDTEARTVGISPSGVAKEFACLINDLHGNTDTGTLPILCFKVTTSDSKVKANFEYKAAKVSGSKKIITDGYDELEAHAPS